IELARDQHERLGRMDAALALIQARQAFAEYQLKRKDTVEAESEYRALLEDSRALSKVHDERAEFSRSEGEALGQLGDLELVHSKTSTSAASLYDAAADAVARVVKARKSTDPKTVAWLLRLHRLSGQQYTQLGDVDAAIERYHRADTARSNQSD